MKFILKTTILIFCLVNLIVTDDSEKKPEEVKPKELDEDETQAEKSNAVFKYKQNVTLDCSKYPNVEYYVKKADGKEETKLENGQKNVNIEDSVLILSDLRREDITAKYRCRSGGKIVQVFVHLVAPYIYKPEKPSQTVTAGGSVEIKCTLLYGNENETPVNWSWKKNNTELTDTNKYKIVQGQNETTITIQQVSEDDKGDYECELKNKHGEHSEKIQLRVKDALAALWPFLAIVAEVIVLCLIILIYEKKCSKKPQSTEEDNEQAQNLMGNKENSDVKKRTAKA